MRLDRYHLYLLWELLVTASMAFVAVEVPEHFVLEYNLYAGPVIYWLITLVLCCDVFAQWYRPARQPGHFVAHGLQRVVSRRMWWLIVDLVAVIPFRLLPGGALFELLRLLKLARVAQFMRRWRHQAVQNAHILRLVFFV